MNKKIIFAILAVIMMAAGILIFSSQYNNVENYTTHNKQRYNPLKRKKLWGFCGLNIRVIKCRHVRTAELL